MNCPQCHSPVLPGARYCAQCGAKLDGDMAPVSAEPAQLRIGRSPDNDICLNDDMVSRYHASLFQQADGSWRLEEPVFKKECCPMKVLLKILLVFLLLTNAGCATTDEFSRNGPYRTTVINLDVDPIAIFNPYHEQINALTQEYLNAFWDAWQKQHRQAASSPAPTYMPSKRSDNAGSKNAPSVQDVEKF